MAITAVNLAYESSNRDGTGGHYVEVYKVASDSQTETQPTLQTASFGGTTIPVYRAAHGDDVSAKCSNIAVSARQKDEDFYHWFVTCTYDDVTSDDLEIVPTDDVVRKFWGYRVESYYPAYSPAFPPGTVKLVNTANGPFSPGIQALRYHKTLRVLRNEASYNPAFAGDMENSVNSTGTTICGLTVNAREARLAGFTAENATRNGFDYWAVTYDVEFALGITGTDVKSESYQGHDEVVQNKGFYEHDDASIPDLSGAYKQEISFLDATGDYTKTPQVIAYGMHKLRSFGSLGLNI